MSDIERRAQMLADYLGSQMLRPCRCEEDLHDAVEHMLRAIPGLPVSREVDLGASGRIDLMAASVGVEVKVEGATKEVLRQVLRYVQNSMVDAVILVTTVSAHRVIPERLGGKPVRVAWVKPW